MRVKKTALKSTNEVLIKYYKATCMKLYTVVIVQGIAVIVLFGMWMFESMRCGG